MHSLNLKLRWLKHLLASFLLSPMASDEKPQLQSFIFRQIFEDRLKRAGGTIQPMSCKVLHFIDSELGLRKQTRLPPHNRDEFPGQEWHVLLGATTTQPGQLQSQCPSPHLGGPGGLEICETPQDLCHKPASCLCASSCKQIPQLGPLPRSRSRGLGLLPWAGKGYNTHCL